MKIFSKYTTVPIIIMILVSLTGLTTLPFVNADSNEDQSLEKWDDKCNKAIEKDSQDAARKADRQYDEHAPEGPLVQCTVWNFKLLIANPPWDFIKRILTQFFLLII